MEKKFSKCAGCGANIREDNMLLHKSKVHPLELTEDEKKMFERKQPEKSEIEKWLEKIAALHKEKGKDPEGNVEWALLASLIIDTKKELFEGVESLADGKIKERLMDRLERYGEYVDHQMHETSHMRSRTREKDMYELSTIRDAVQTALKTFKDMPQAEILDGLEQNLTRQARASAFSRTMDKLKTGSAQQKELASWVERNFEYLNFIEKYSIISEEKSPEEDIGCLYTFFTLTAELGQIKNPAGMDDGKIKEACLAGLAEMKEDALKKKTEGIAEIAEDALKKSKEGKEGTESKNEPTAETEASEAKSSEKHLRIIDSTIARISAQSPKEILSGISKCFSTKYIEKPEIERLIASLKEGDGKEAGEFLEKNYRRIKKFENVSKEDTLWLNVFSVMLNVPDMFLGNSENLKKYLTLFVGAFAKAPQKAEEIKYIAIDKEALATAEKELEPLSVPEIFAKITGTFDRLAQENQPK